MWGRPTLLPTLEFTSSCSPPPYAVLVSCETPTTTRAMMSRGARASRPRPPVAKRFPRRSWPSAHAPRLRRKPRVLPLASSSPRYYCSGNGGVPVPGRAGRGGGDAGGAGHGRPPGPSNSDETLRQPIPPPSAAPPPAAPPAGKVGPLLPVPPPSRQDRAPLPACGLSPLPAPAPKSAQQGRKRGGRRQPPPSATGGAGGG